MTMDDHRPRVVAGARSDHRLSQGWVRYDGGDTIDRIYLSQGGGVEVEQLRLLLEKFPEVERVVCTCCPYEQVQKLGAQYVTCAQPTSPVFSREKTELRRLEGLAVILRVIAEKIEKTVESSRDQNVVLCTEDLKNLELVVKQLHELVSLL